MSNTRFLQLTAIAVLALAGCQSAPRQAQSVDLFPHDGVPRGWTVRHWADVRNPPPEGAVWQVAGGILIGAEPRGTWLVSEREFGDFIIEFEFKLPPRGNSGLGLRFPMQGDPAFDGLELQMVDPRYFGDATAAPSELTGSLYRAVAPRVQAFRPDEWNRYEIALRGPEVKVVLNGELILDVDLDEETRQPQRHDGSLAPPLRDRPRRGHIGFQELSRGDGHVQIRNVRIAELN